MRYLSSVLVLIAILALAGCIGSDSESGEHSGDSESGEHGVGTESGDGGEEAGTQFALDETFDRIRAGARLVLSYDPASNAFIGNVENTTDITLRRVRVEVHLSNGPNWVPQLPLTWLPASRSTSRCRQPTGPSLLGAPTPRSADCSREEWRRRGGLWGFLLSQTRRGASRSAPTDSDCS